MFFSLRENVSAMEKYSGMENIWVGLRDVSELPLPENLKTIP